MKTFEYGDIDGKIIGITTGKLDDLDTVAKRAELFATANCISCVGDTHLGDEDILKQFVARLAKELTEIKQTMDRMWDVLKEEGKVF